jgi:hypothetical protein
LRKVELQEKDDVTTAAAGNAVTAHWSNNS